MTFIIRTIGQRSGGGEIVRERPVDAAAILVGRGTDCDLEIADLAVMLNHARVRRQGNHVEVAAIGGVDLVVDGKSTDRAEFGSDQTVVLLLGGHRVTVAPGEGGTTLLTLERLGALSDAADPSDEAQVFSLGGTRLSKRGLAWGFVILALIAFLAWPVTSGLLSPPVSPLKAPPPQIQADSSWTSGPLSQAHAGLSNKCGACHQQPFVAVRDSACKACHIAIKDHAAPKRLAAASFDSSLAGTAKRGLAHGFNLPQGSCTSCHKEHDGPHGAAMSNPALCVDCHRELSKRLPDTKLGNADDFGTAHPEFQPNIVIAPSFGAPLTRRETLTPTTAEFNGLKFPHDIHLLAGGSVTRMAKSLPRYGKALGCAACHTEDPSRARFQPIEMERDCLACHSLEIGKSNGVVRTLRHGDAAQAIAEMEDFLAANPGAPAPPTLRTRPGAIAALPVTGGTARTSSRVRALFETGGTCFECHSVIPPARAGSLDFRIAPVSLQSRYLQNGWFSHADHATETSPCASCHLAAKSKDSSDLLIQGIGSCRDCHAGAHPKGKQIASDCQSCHSFHAASPLASQIRAAKQPAAIQRGRT